MPRQQWSLRHGKPRIEVMLTLAAQGASVSRTLLADTGAGSQNSAFQLLLDEDDCLLCGGNPDQSVTLGGAYVGPFPTYFLTVEIPTLGFRKNLRVVGVPKTPFGFDGIACFAFLNQFHYGNFGDPTSFGLEC